MKRLLLPILFATILLVIMKLPILADPLPPHPISANIQENGPAGLIEDTAAITFTPVATIHLPIVIQRYPPAPTITNISYALMAREYPDCNFVDYYRISFDYTDPDGDGDRGFIQTMAIALPSGDTSENLFVTQVIPPSNGYQGRAFVDGCVEFTDSDTEIIITVFLIDGALFPSNHLDVTIPRS